MKDSTSLLADRHIGPALAVEDSGNLEALDPGLYRVQVFVEEKVDHQRIFELEVIGLSVQRIARRLVLLAVRQIYDRIEVRIREKGDISARPLVLAVQKRVQEVLGVRIVGPPFL